MRISWINLNNVNARYKTGFVPKTNAHKMPNVDKCKSCLSEKNSLRCWTTLVVRSGRKACSDWTWSCNVWMNSWNVESSVQTMCSSRTSMNLMRECRSGMIIWIGRGRMCSNVSDRGCPGKSDWDSAYYQNPYRWIISRFTGHWSTSSLSRLVLRSTPSNWLHLRKPGWRI